MINRLDTHSSYIEEHIQNIILFNRGLMRIT